MELFNYLVGQGGLMLLGLFAVIALLYNRYKTERYFKYIDKRQKDKKSKNLT